MHSWGDGFNFRKLEEIGVEIQKELERKTFCTLMWKEKYGTLRYEYIFPPYGGIFITKWWQRIYWESKLYCYLQSRAWRKLVKICLKKAKQYPDFEDEILQDIAGNEELVGKELHDKYWRTL